MKAIKVKYSLALKNQTYDGASPDELQNPRSVF